MKNRKNIKRTVALLVMIVAMFGTGIPVRADKHGTAKILDVYLSDDKGTMLNDSNGSRLGLKDVKIGETVYFTIKINNTQSEEYVKVYIKKQSGLSLNKSKAVQLENTNDKSDTGYWQESTYKSEDKSEECYSLEIASTLRDKISDQDSSYITLCYPVEITEDIALNEEKEQKVFLVRKAAVSGEGQVTYTPENDKPAKVRVLGFTVKVTDQDAPSICLKDVGFTLTKKGDEEGTSRFTDENGEIVFSGLTASTEYILKQNTSIEGYDLRTAPITAKIDENGDIFFDDSTTSGDTITIRMKAIAMPNTGNHGTAAFSIIGCAFIAVAIVLSIAFKKHYLSK